jgi:hypothetical protein
VGIHYCIDGICDSTNSHKHGDVRICSKTSLIRTNWERTLFQISESPNYKSATENMFREVIKWTSRVFLGNTKVLVFKNEI